MLPTNCDRPALMPLIRLPRNPIGSAMMSPITPAALARTFSSMFLSWMIVLITPAMASIALSMRPLLAAFISSMRASSASRDSTYLRASVSTISLCLDSMSDSSCSNWLSSFSSASWPTFLRSCGSAATYLAISALPWAMRARAALRPVPTMSAILPITPSMSAR